MLDMLAFMDLTNLTILLLVFVGVLSSGESLSAVYELEDNQEKYHTCELKYCHNQLIHAYDMCLPAVTDKSCG